MGEKKVLHYFSRSWAIAIFGRKFSAVFTFSDELVHEFGL